MWKKSDIKVEKVQKNDFKRLKTAKFGYFGTFFDSDVTIFLQEILQKKALAF